MKRRRAFGRSRRARILLAAVVFFAASGPAVSAQDVALRLDPERTTIHFTLGDVLHTVRGTFRLKQGELRLDPGSGKLTGQIAVDAKSGESGSGMRDRKMHREVLESDQYPEISFRPDRVEGAVAAQGKSTVRVHGMFSVHGVDHDLTVPVEVEISGEHWTAALHFAVPYARWGMKNPSTLFLRVSDSVDIDLAASGSVIRGN